VKVYIENVLVNADGIFTERIGMLHPASTEKVREFSKLP